MAAISPYSTDSQYFDEVSSSLGWVSVWEECVYTPTRLKTAFKMALGCTIVMVLGFTFNWDYVFLGMIPVVLFNRQDARFDLRQLLFAACITGCVGSVLYWSLNFSQDPIVFGLVLAAVTVPLGALMTIPVFGPCFLMGQIIPIVVLVLYFDRLATAKNVFFAVTVVACLGLVTVLVVNYILWPYSPRQEWDERLRNLVRTYRDAYAHWFRRPGNGGRVQRPNPLDRQVFALIELLDTLKPVDPMDMGLKLRARAATRMQDIAIHLQDLRRASRNLEGRAISPAFAELGAIIDRQFTHLFDLLAGGRAGNPTTRAALEAAAQAAGDSLSSREAGEMIRQDFQLLCTALEDCSEIFRAMGQLPAAEHLARRRQTLIWTPPFHWNLLLRLNRASFHHGIKNALIIGTCITFWQAFRWPAGASILISGLTVTLPSAGSATRQALLRVWGLLLGLVCAYACIALVVTRVDTIFEFGLYVFCFLMALGYLSTQSLRVGYVGFQAVITFVFILVFTNHQTIDLDPLRERFVALVTGAVLADVIILNLWPVRHVNGFFSSLAGNFATCARAWAAFRRYGPDLESNYHALVAEFNQGLLSTGRLGLTVEFEGGEGSPRYGFGARLFIHEIALFEQMRLLMIERIGGCGGQLPAPRADQISSHFGALARRLGQPVDVDFEPVGELPAGLAGTDGILDRRAREIEQILDSMDRLTSFPMSS
jgi:uncharacterized membrane protein YccC